MDGGCSQLTDSTDREARLTIANSFEKTNCRASIKILQRHHPWARNAGARTKYSRIKTTHIQFSLDHFYQCRFRTVTPDVLSTNLAEVPPLEVRKTMKTKKVHIAVLTGLLLVVTAPVLLAQIASGTIVGTAFDPTDAIVAGAEIILSNIQTQLRRTVVTDSAGNFTAPQLPVGVYKLSGTARHPSNARKWKTLRCW